MARRFEIAFGCILSSSYSAKPFKKEYTSKLVFLVFYKIDLNLISFLTTKPVLFSVLQTYHFVSKLNI